MKNVGSILDNVALCVCGWHLLVKFFPTFKQSDLNNESLKLEQYLQKINFFTQLIDIV